MGLFDRMGRVISSNVNALLDKAEDPKKLVGLNLDEMGDQLRAGRQDVLKAKADAKVLKIRVDEARTEAGKWEKRAELALRGGDEALAREALKQKKRADEQAQAAEKARLEQEDLASTMREELERMEKKLNELTLRKGTIAARASQAKAAAQAGKSGGGSESLGARGGSNAFAEFRRMEERVEGVEAEASARNEVEEALGKGAAGDDLEAKFRELERGAGGSSRVGGPDVENDLAELKKRIRI